MADFDAQREIQRGAQRLRWNVGLDVFERKIMKLQAEWTNDCSGKKDYYGNILSISTRYWPSGGGFYVLDADCFRENKDGRKPSAHSSLVVWKEDGDTETLVDRHFEGDTFEAVAAQVEPWAQEQMDKAVAALRLAFLTPNVANDTPPKAVAVD